jgi:predicted dehydrogenase/nucleoside-diphosphate-sugar epimerase
VLIAGAGSMAAHHTRAVQALASRAELVGIADPDPAARRRLAELAPGAREADSLEQWLAAGQADVVHVCTPQQTHAELAARALAAGCHVYVEKPFATTAMEAQAVLDQAKSRGLSVCAGHQLLCEAPARAALELLPHLGRLTHVESYFAFRPLRRAGTGALLASDEQLLDILPHPIYLAQRVLRAAQPGAELEISQVRVGPGATVHAHLAAGPLCASLAVTLEGRPVGSYLRLVGTRGTVQADFVRGTVQTLLGPGSSGIEKLLEPLRVALQLLLRTPAALWQRVRSSGRSYPGLTELIERFYDGIEGGAPALDPQEILATVRACEVIAHAVAGPAPAVAAPPAASAPRVLVSGASGFLGARVCRALREHGVVARALVRRRPAPWERLPGVEYVHADLAGALPQGSFAGVRAVVHCAAATSGGWAQHERDSLRATEQLLEQAARAGVPHFVHVSSLAVVSEEGHEPVSELSPLEPAPRSRGPYTWGKLCAEQRARELGDELGISVHVARPGALLDRAALDAPGRLGRRIGNLLIAVGRRRDPLPVIDVDLCAQLLAWIAAHGEQAPALVHLLQPQLPTRAELVRRLREQSPGLRVLWLPWALLRALSHAALLAQRALGRPEPIELARVFGSRACDTSGTAALLAQSQREEPPLQPSAQAQTA